MRIFISILSVFVLFACKNDPKKSAAPADATGANPFTTVAGEPLPQDFLDFYEKFHADSVFQMGRIQWPLQGQKTMEINGVRTKGSMTWTAEKWARHRPLDLQGGMFERKFSMLGDMVIIEMVENKNIGIQQERRFAKVAGDDWSLIYYSEM